MAEGTHPRTITDLLEVVRRRMPTMSASGRMVAEAVLAAPDEVIGMSAARLAAVSGSSVGSVVRFCHSLGLPGYQDFKLRLVAAFEQTRFERSLDRRRSMPVGPVDTTFSQTLVALTRTADSIEPLVLERAADAVRDAKRILIPSSGPSQPIALALGSWLSWSGFSVSYPTDTETQRRIADRFGEEDLCFAVSHSGTTANTLDPTRIAAERGARTVLLTSFADSPLSRLCDVVIVAGAPADRYRSADMASRPIHLAVVQALSATIQHSLPRPA